LLSKREKRSLRGEEKKKVRQHDPSLNSGSRMRSQRKGKKRSSIVTTALNKRNNSHQGKGGKRLELNLCQNFGSRPEKEENSSCTIAFSPTMKEEGGMERH